MAFSIKSDDNQKQNESNGFTLSAEVGKKNLKERRQEIKTQTKAENLVREPSEKVFGEGLGPGLPQIQDDESTSSGDIAQQSKPSQPITEDLFSPQSDVPENTSFPQSQPPQNQQAQTQELFSSQIPDDQKQSTQPTVNNLFPQQQQQGATTENLFNKPEFEPDFELTPDEDTEQTPTSAALSTESDPQNLSQTSQSIANVSDPVLNTLVSSVEIGKDVAQGTLRNVIADPGATVSRNLIPGTDDKDVQRLADSDISEAIFGDVENFGITRSGREVTEIFGGPGREDEGGSALDTFGQGLLGAGMGLLDAIPGGGKATKFALKAGDDVLPDVMRFLRSNADEAAEISNRSEMEDFIRQSDADLADEDVENLANELVKRGNESSVKQSVDAFDVVTRTDNAVNRLASDEAVSDFVNASSRSEVEEILSRSDEDAGRLFSSKQRDEVIDNLKNAESTDEVKNALRSGATKSLKERGFVSSVNNMLPDNQVVSGDRVVRNTKDLANRARRLVENDPEKAKSIMRTQDDDEAVAVASAYVNKISKQARNASGAEKSALIDEAAKWANNVSKKLTKAGRTSQAATILGKMTPQAQLRTAAKAINDWNEKAAQSSTLRQVDELTEEQSEEIINRAEEIRNMEDGRDKQRALFELQKFINNLTPTEWWDKATTAWKTGLLTSPATSTLNLLSAAGHATTELISKVPAALADSIASLATGERSVTATARGLGQGFYKGVQRGKEYFQTGFDSREIAQKLDYKKPNFENEIFQKYTDTVFRWMGTQDQPFYYATLQNSYYDQALARAKNKGLSGKEKEKFVENLLENPDQEIVKNATTDAATAVFQNDTFLAQIGSKIQGIPKGIGQVILPFNRTPASVATQVVNYSPVGIFRGINEAATGKFLRDNFDQRFFSRMMGRGVTGTGLMWLGAKLYENDMVTTGFPRGDERKQELAFAEGKDFNSIKIGDKWRDAIAFGPVGANIVMGAKFKEQLNDKGSTLRGMASALNSAKNTVLQHSFMQGIKQFNDALLADDVSRIESYVANLSSSAIPTILSDTAAALDPKARETFDRNFTENVSQSVQQRIPGLRENLEPAVDILGRERPNPEHPIEAILDGTRPSFSTEGPISKELRRLTDKGYQVSPTRLGDGNGYENMTKSQVTNLWKKTGKLTQRKLAGLLNTKEYDKLPDDKKVEAIKDVIDEAKVRSRAFSALRITEGLQGRQLKKKLAELKKGGLLTREVFDMYSQIREL